jgi:competence protein ComEA
MTVFLEKLFVFCKDHTLVLGVGMAGLLCLVYGLLNLNTQSMPSDGVKFESGKESTAVKSGPSAKVVKEIMVDVEGAVRKPGVYKLKSDSRIRDAIFQAGGLSDSADREKSAQSLNLAAPLTDGAKLYIPSVGEEIVTSSGTSTGVANTTAVLGTNSQQININQASETELDTLSGVGTVTAQKIINNRPYSRIEELTEKKVVGASVFEKIKGQIAVY